MEEEVKIEEAPVRQEDERRYLKLLDSQGISQEAYLLDIISKCSPKMLGQISTLHEHTEQMEWVGNCFMELVNLIIYERTELFEGWNQLQRYCSHKYDAYQHFLILKSCADLQKFNIDAIALLDTRYIST